MKQARNTDGVLPGPRLGNVATVRPLAISQRLFYGRPLNRSRILLPSIAFTRDRMIDSGGTCIRMRILLNQCRSPDIRNGYRRFMYRA